MARKMIDFSRLKSDELEEFKNRYDAYIFDMDGCLVTLEKGPMEGVNETLNEIARNGKCIKILTDNCLHTLNAIATKINGFFPVIKKENVINSGYLLLKYLKDINFNKKIYAMASESGVITELRDNGFEVLYDNEQIKISVPDLRKIKLEDGVGAVLIGGDTNFNYLKMFKAVNYLADPEILLIQTHLLNTVERNPIIPAAGAIVASLKASSGRKETICVGKGSEYSTKYLNSLGFEAHRCLFVGDDISSDMEAGNMSGMDTMLVLSGCSTLEMVESAEAENLKNRIPTYYANSVADLIKVFKN
ncbi:uncharacterized protein [Halyomorpha halys]|uniref:uncharacterized protein n=1 Tax=Halyomorpha halys TaxID=286706 RepID=UPI0006D4D375|nr:4-nitrophenylphosphatase-like [Halyomorpha halys]